MEISKLEVRISESDACKMLEAGLKKLASKLKGSKAERLCDPRIEIDVDVVTLGATLTEPLPFVPDANFNAKLRVSFSPQTGCISLLPITFSSWGLETDVFNKFVLYQVERLSANVAGLSVKDRAIVVDVKALVDVFCGKYISLGRVANVAAEAHAISISIC